MKARTITVQRSDNRRRNERPEVKLSFHYSGTGGLFPYSPRGSFTSQ